MKTSLVLMLLFFVSACSPGTGAETDFAANLPENIRDLENLTVYPADSEPAYEINLVREQGFGIDSGPLIGVLFRSFVDDQNRVIIMERASDGFRLQAYNPDGSYHSQIGRQGDGPGEYRIFSRIHTTNGQLNLYDQSLGRFTIYNTDDYKFERSFFIGEWGIESLAITANYRIDEVYTRNDGNYLVQLMENSNRDQNIIHSKYLVVDESGTVLSEANPQKPSYSITEIAESRGGTMRISFSFNPRGLIDIAIDNSMYYVWGETFLIEKYDSEGRYESAIYYPVKGPVLDIDAYMDAYPSPMFNSLDMTDTEWLPERWPAVSSFFVDDENRLWVSLNVESQDIHEWWVLEESGEKLATFEWPRENVIASVKDGYLYSRETDEESGLTEVVKYRIELNDI